MPALPCPLCAALVTNDEAHITRHAVWHEDSSTAAPPWAETVQRFHEARDWLRLAAPARDDDAPTAKLPPIGDTVRRRPPVPAPIRDLSGADLVRALMAELEQELRDEEAHDL